ncbi:MAG: Holliday junction resolvase RuvX [Alistipes sp.]|nr:Holliday junction resolvase RuvX [Alistipes sp.]
MARLLAIDYGTKRTGIAVSDPLGIIAQPLETVDTKSLERFVLEYCQREDVQTIVVGHPRQMSGEASETMRYIEPLVGRLRRAHPDKQVVLFDERFTSVLAQRTILQSGIGKMARRDKSLVDKVSAAIILQDYMASVGM